MPPVHPLFHIDSSDGSRPALVQFRPFPTGISDLARVEFAIEKWTVIRDWHATPEGTVGEVNGHGQTTCALCVRYLKEYCARCPVKAVSGAWCCLNTPYERYRNHPSAESAQQEVDFLQRVKQHVIATQPVNFYVEPFLELTEKISTLIVRDPQRLLNAKNQDERVRLSVEKWRAIEEFHRVNPEAEHSVLGSAETTTCALCAGYYKLAGTDCRCVQCPINTDGAHDHCRGTPFVAYVKNPCEETARAEREFLEALLPPLTASDIFAQEPSSSRKAEQFIQIDHPPLHYEPIHGHRVLVEAGRLKDLEEQLLGKKVVISQLNKQIAYLELSLREADQHEETLKAALALAARQRHAAKDLIEYFLEPES